MDDSQLFLDVAMTALCSAGYEVHRLSSLGQLDRLVGVPDVDLVLMDVQMPEVYGDDLAMVLREVRGLRAPIYLLSSLDDAALAERATGAGVQGYLRKHDGMEALVRQVDDIFAEGSFCGPPVVG